MLLATPSRKSRPTALRVQILATSRQPLGIIGEQTYRLASLGLSASVALFHESAQRVDASFLLNGDLQTVERICRRLDGIALAIELAAARVRLLSVAQIEELLSQRFAILTGGGLARHQTMRALIDWSYDLLSLEERSFFCRLGIFPAEFSFEAGLAICSGDGSRSRMFLKFSRRLSISRCSPANCAAKRGDSACSRRCALTPSKSSVHRSADSANGSARYYLTLVEAGDTRTPEWRDALEADYDNLRRALEWAIDENGDVPLGIRLLAGMREFLLYRGLGADSARRAERALDGRTPLAKPLQAMAWETISAMRGDRLMPAAALEASRERSHSMKNSKISVGSRALCATAAWHISVSETSGKLKRICNAALELQQRIPRRTRSRPNARIDRGELSGIMGQPTEGCKAMLEVLEMARQEGDERLAGVTVMNLAEVEFALGEIESSVQRLKDLLASTAGRKNVRLRANARANLAVYLLALHRDEAARATARAAVVDARQAGDAGIVACAVQHLAAMLARADPRTAAKLLGFVNDVFATGFQRENTERYTYELLSTALHEKLSDDEIGALAREGAAMSELQAARLATRGTRWYSGSQAYYAAPEAESP